MLVWVLGGRLCPGVLAAEADHAPGKTALPPSPSQVALTEALDMVYDMAKKEIVITF